MRNNRSVTWVIQAIFINRLMIKQILGFALGLSGFLWVSCSSVKTDDILTAGTKQGEYVILTDKLTESEDFYGYENSNIPLRIYISEGKISKVEAYDHAETPDYFVDVEAKLLPAWNGLTIAEALQQTPDAVSGATYSSEAVIKSVVAGLKYAQEKGI